MTCWSAPRAASPCDRHGAASLGDARREQLAHERGGQGRACAEVEGALGVAVPLDVGRDGRERLSAEGVVGAAIRGSREAGHDTALATEGGDAVADALL